MIARLLSEKSLTRHSFHVMESKVSRNCTRNIHRPSTPEKEVNRKDKHRGKDCQKGLLLGRRHSCVTPLFSLFSYFGL